MVDLNLDRSIKYLDSKKDLEDCISENHLLLFTASWCGPCKKMAPIVDDLSLNDKFKDITFYKVDVDDCEELCDDYDIKCMPTFIFLKNKKQVDIHSGCDTDALESKLLSNFCDLDDNLSDLSDNDISFNRNFKFDDLLELPPFN
jgi:thioredoxin 1